ncbi:Type I secretion system ATPase, LssB family LapB [uncultured Candidatus Thioglobus sp.]|nr:Type I secretion system ATPase, LssB family LapB [uncultured Candidatus Thioglobus sp.]SMM99483.1 Type I secretion system ATPase, LssB family LapB [uncultured Candidatus Thioglobus sp.]
MFLKLKLLLNKIHLKLFGTPHIKTTTMLQMAMTECGAASLRIILDYHKIYRSLEELRILCGVSRDGSNAADLVKTAKQFNLDCQPVNTDINEINKKITFPAILFWNFNHFLVLEGYDEENQIFYINDPASGRRKVYFQEFDQSFTGIAINFSKNKDYQPSGSPEKSYGRFYPILKESMPALWFIVTVTLLLVVPGIAIPVFSQIFIDDILIAGNESIATLLILGMIMMLLVQAILIFLQKITLVLLGTKLSAVNSIAFVTHMLKLPIMFFSQRYIGDLVNRVELNERIAMALSNNIAINIINLLTSIIYGIVLLTYDWLLGLVAITAMAFNLVALKALRNKQNNANQVMYKEQSALFGVSSNGLSMIETIKSSGMELSFFRKWSGYQAKMLNAKGELSVYAYILGLTPVFLNSFAIVAVLYIGSFQVLDGLMTVGMLIAFQSLMQSFMGPISNLVGFASELQLLKGDIERSNDVLNHNPDPLISITDSNNDNYKSLSGDIVIKDMSFSYARYAVPLFDKFNLHIKPGSVVAIVGGSGSGKSTLVQLLSRLYYPKSGSISIDGINLNKINRFLFSQSVAVVSQNISLFQGSIRDNLTFWDSSVDNADIYNALKDASILDMVNKLPDGYNYQIKEGGKNFSGGQRQCLEIARALTGNPSVLILDEATSALDSIIEAKIIDNLKHRGCTCIFVAHRLSAIRDAHNIIVLDQGKIVQTGTHNTLIKEDNIYQKLITSQ